VYGKSGLGAGRRTGNADDIGINGNSSDQRDPGAAPAGD